MEVCFGTTQRTSAGREEHSLENRCWERWALVNYDVSHNKENKCWEDGGVLNLTQPVEQELGALRDVTQLKEQVLGEWGTC